MYQLRYHFPFSIVSAGENIFVVIRFPSNICLKPEENFLVSIRFGKLPKMKGFEIVKLPAEKYLSIQISYPRTVVESRMCVMHKDVKILRRC